MDTKDWPIPQWKQLPESVREDLRKPGYDADWFNGTGKDEEVRLTLLLLYVK